MLLICKCNQSYAVTLIKRIVVQGTKAEGLLLLFLSRCVCLEFQLTFGRNREHSCCSDANRAQVLPPHTHKQRDRSFPYYSLRTLQLTWAGGQVIYALELICNGKTFAWVHTRVLNKRNLQWKHSHINHKYRQVASENACTNYKLNCAH